MAKLRVDVDGFVDKHARRTKGAIDDLRKGVGRVTEAPGAKAAAKVDKWHERVSDSRTKDKWARRVGSVSLEEWKKDMIEKGAGRVSAGIDRSEAKVRKFASQLLAHESTLKDEIDGMSDLTLEDSIQRASAWIRGMAEFEFER